MQAPEHENARVADLYCQTKGKYFKTICQWSIHNFSLMDVFDLESPIFSSKECDKIKWCLHARSFVDSYNTGYTYLSLHITLVSDDNIKANVKFLILQGNKEIDPIKSFAYITFSKKARWGHEKFVTLQNLNQYLSNDKLTIICEISVFLDITTIELNIGNGSMIKVPKCNLKVDLGNLLENELLYDVVLAVGEYEYKAHKSILATRSPVFAAMFEHEMIERTHDRVVIVDMKPLVLKEMLHFIYTGKSSNIKEMAQELLVAADKYDLEILKTMCEKELSEHLSIANAAEILAYADQHSAGQLKIRALQYINRNKSGVINSMGWQNLLKSNIDLIQQVLMSLNLD